jgi:hypothetical protein
LCIIPTFTKTTFLLIIKENILAQLFVIYTRYLVGSGFVFASIVKIKGERFTTVSHEDAPFGTAFHFFETMYQTGIYWQFLGWGQLFAGLLLMTQRFAKLGAVVFFPIILNVFVITISMEFAFTPVITFLMLMANLLLLLWHWDELKILLNLTPTLPDANRLENKKIWEITGWILFLMTAGYRAINTLYNPMLWMGMLVLVGLIPLILVGVQRKKYLRF